MDLLSGKDSSANAISDKMKEILFAKSADKVDGFRSNVADSMFNSTNSPTQSEVDAEDDYTPETPEVETPAVGEVPTA